MDAAWYVSIDGSLSGPFSAEQLRGLVEAGKVAPSALAQSQPRDHDPSEKRPISDILEARAQFVPTDATESLFRTLQAAKEKQQRSSHESKSPRKTPILLSRSLFLVIGIALVLGSLVWGTTRWMASRSRPIEPASHQEPPPQQMIVQPIPVAKHRAVPVLAAKPDHEREQDRLDRERAESERRLDEQESRTPEPHPGDEGVVSLLAREQGLRLDEEPPPPENPQPPSDDSMSDPQPP